MPPCCASRAGRWIIPAVRRGCRRRSTSTCWRAPSPGPARRRRRATKRSTSPMATSSPGRMSGRRSRMRSDMKPGNAVPLSLAQNYPQWIAPWDALRRKHDLISPDLEAFVGLSFQYADYTMRYGQTQAGPALDRLDREDQPGRFYRDDGHRSDVPQMVQAGAGEPAVAVALLHPALRAGGIRSRALTSQTPLPSPCAS